MDEPLNVQLDGFHINMKAHEIILEKDFILQTLYSKLKEAWIGSTILIKYPFPIVAMTRLKFQLVEGWHLSPSSHRYVYWGIWDEIDENGTLKESYQSVNYADFAHSLIPDVF